MDHGHQIANEDPESVDPPVIYVPILLCVQQARGLPFGVASGSPELRAAPPVLPRDGADLLLRWGLLGLFRRGLLRLEKHRERVSSRKLLLNEQI